MKCVTYGTTIFIMMIVIFIFQMIIRSQLPETEDVTWESISSLGKLFMVGFGILCIGQIGLLLWWVVGFFSDCSGGYLMAPSLGKCTKEKE